MTSHPTNESELQLYRVLQRAKLLSYYDTFIAQGRTRLVPMGLNYIELDKYCLSHIVLASITCLWPRLVPRLLVSLGERLTIKLLKSRPKIVE